MRKLVQTFLLFLIVTVTTVAYADDGESSSFSPTWRLLQGQEKQQFVAGYIQGWRDAAKVTDIAISYVRSNPDRAIEGLEGVRALYNLSGMKPAQLVQEIDAFYSDPENGASPLSAAITAARRRVIK